MKRLFSDEPAEPFNATGEKIAQEITDLIRPFIKKMVRRRVSLREVNYLIDKTVAMEVALAILGERGVRFGRRKKR